MKNLYEIFEEFEKAVTREEKKIVLWKNNTIALRTILFYTFEPSIKFFMTTPPKEYKPSISPPGMGEANIQREVRRLYMFIENNPDVPAALIDNKKKRENLLIGFLEGLEEKEAAVVLKMMRKDLKVKGLTYLLVREAFPDLPWGENKTV